MKVKDFSFREIDQEICYVEKTEELEELLSPFEDASDSTGFLGYGFVDHEKGVMFEVLCRAKKEDDDFQTLPTQFSVSVSIPMKDIFENEMEVLEVNPKIYDKKIKKVKDHTPLSVKQLRELDFIDDCRDTCCPDFVQVHFGTEKKWVKMMGLNEKEGCLEGVLLDNQDTLVKFALKKNEDGELICFCL
ncbi:MAG: hypothetical protein Q4C49_10135 [Bacillota bacterium]|nr:hypothetical protein [Bacillota bacterium]